MWCLAIVGFWFLECTGCTGGSVAIWFNHVPGKGRVLGLNPAAFMFMVGVAIALRDAKRTEEVRPPRQLRHVPRPLSFPALLF